MTSGSPSPAFDVTAAATPATIEDLNWQRQAERARVTGLSTIQQTAERWGATLLAVTGLLATVTTVLGTRDVVNLRGMGWRVLAGATAGAALVSAGTALLLAALAAQGKVRHIVTSGPELRKVSNEQARTADCQLRWSRYVSLAVLPLYLCAIGVVTYAPRMIAPRIAVTVTNGERLCATSVSNAPNGMLALRLAGGASVTLAPAQVSSIASTTSCA